MTIRVVLTPAEVHQMIDAAKHRWMGKLGSVDKPSYSGDNKKYMEHDFLASWRAATTEWAVAKYLGETWAGQITYPNSEHPVRKNLPDVGTNYEVRARRTRDAIPVWEKDIQPGKIVVGTEVVDDSTFSQVNIFGWLPMEEVKSVGEFFDGRYYVPIEAFKDFSAGAI